MYTGATKTYGLVWSITFIEFTAWLRVYFASSTYNEQIHNEVGGMYMCVGNKLYLKLNMVVYYNAIIILRIHVCPCMCVYYFAPAVPGIDICKE